MSKYFKGFCFGLGVMYIGGFLTALLDDLFGDPHTGSVFFLAGGLAMCFYCRIIDRKGPAYTVRPIQLYPEASQPLVCTYEMTRDEAREIGKDLGTAYLMESYKWSPISGHTSNGMGMCKVYLVPDSGIIEVMEK
jgi:hypothetical protein